MSVTIDPRRHDAVLFDLDGVITDTASVHAVTWAALFNDYLAGRAPGAGAGEDLSPFTDADYRRFIDGKPRYDGVRDLLASRGITLPPGHPDDTPDTETVCGLGNRKQVLFTAALADGVPVFETTVALVHQLHRAGLGTAIFSSSRNCAAVLAAAGIPDLFEVRIDGVAAAELGLPGKPDPATLVAAADRLGVRPGRTAIVEDAESGVAAGRAGGFALVIGVDRTAPGSGHAQSLRAHGADVVVADLGEVTVRTGDARMSALPSALTLPESLAGRHPAVFFDFDGTLSPIVADPGSARPAPHAAEALAALAAVCPVAVLSGRDLADVTERVGVPGLWYAGSHGFELTGPDGAAHRNEAAAAAVPVLAEAAAALRTELAAIAGVTVEPKRFAVAVHYRNAARDAVGAVCAAVRDAGRRHRLRVTTGREVIELRPDLDWDKGATLHWILGRLDGVPVTAVFIGDDITDEDAFDAVADPVGVGIVVRHFDDGDRATAARFALDGPGQVVDFTARLAAAIGAHRNVG